MAATLDREGHFRVIIDSYGLEKAKESNSHCVVLKCTVLEQYDFDTAEWQDWRQYDAVEVWGRIWIIKKDGHLNQAACESLMRHAGWDGDLMSLQNQTWIPTTCSVSVEENVWEGKTSFKVGFINGYDEAPSGKVGNVDEVSAKQLAAQYGSSLRALAGTVKQNSGKPNGKPPAAPKKPIQVPTPEELAKVPATDHDVPF